MELGSSMNKQNIINLLNQFDIEGEKNRLNKELSNINNEIVVGENS